MIQISLKQLVAFHLSYLKAFNWIVWIKNDKYLNMNIYSYLETSGGQSSNQNLNVAHFYNTSAN
jgi:hypothetical protein